MQSCWQTKLSLARTEFDAEMATSVQRLTNSVTSFRSTIDGALSSCPLVQRVGPIKGNIQGYPWGDYYQYDLLDVGIERVDALLPKLKEEDPAGDARIEDRVSRGRAC